MNLFLPIIKSFSQIFFQENIILGILIMIGLLIASPTALFLALLGSASSLLTAHVLGVQKEVIETGLFGFNGILIGTAASFYVKEIPLAMLVAVIGSVIGAFIFYILFKNQIPAFAAPFVLVTWGIIVAIKLLR